VTGPDDLLLLLVQHWARDQSIFPTEDDRLDLSTIMLFQSYTGCRPAELVHSSRGRAGQDPLAEVGNTDKDRHYRETDHYDDDSDLDDDDNDDDDDNNDYNTDGTDNAVTEDSANCYTAELNEFGEPIRKCNPYYNTAELDEFEEPIRKYKALCYEDICLWVVQDPKQGERDLLAMEVHLRHHKGADNKPKPYVIIPCVLFPS
jgi:hypothetical protein